MYIFLAECEEKMIRDGSPFSDYINIIDSKENRLLENILTSEGEILPAGLMEYRLQIAFNYVFNKPIIKGLSLRIDPADDVESVKLVGKDGTGQIVTKVCILGDNSDLSDLR